MKKMKNDIFLELEAEKIQKMPLKQWRTIAMNGVHLLENKGEIKADKEEIETDKEDISEKIQKLSLKKLRSLQGKERILVTPTLEDKVIITGLSQEIINKLETQKEKATLEEIMTYCSRLKIPFREFLPELFVSSIKTV